jgi:hypothetical protein
VDLKGDLEIQGYSTYYSISNLSHDRIRDQEDISSCCRFSTNNVLTAANRGRGGGSLPERLEKVVNMSPSAPGACSDCVMETKMETAGNDPTTIE